MRPKNKKDRNTIYQWLLFIALAVIAVSLWLYPYSLNRTPEDRLKSTMNETTYHATLIAEGLGVLWGMAFLTEHQAVLTERTGRIVLLDIKSGHHHLIHGAPAVFAHGQGGLLDIAVLPGHPTGKLLSEYQLFLTYSKEMSNGSTTALYSATFRPGESPRTLKNGRDLFIAQPTKSTSRHYGSRIAFDSPDTLFLTVGDRGHREYAQDLGAHLGKVLRLKTNGQAAAGNPFSDTSGALPEIWSYGHRNPQGLYWDAHAKELWSQEHGPKGGDELNKIGKGLNYGWPVITYGEEYVGGVIGVGTSAPFMEQPIHYYVPSIAPCGLTRVSGQKYPELSNRFALGALKLRHVNVVATDTTPTKEIRLFEYAEERVRNVVSSPAGLLYFTTDSGKVFRLEPSQ